jgi:hypothetical protein
MQRAHRNAARDSESPPDEQESRAMPGTWQARATRWRCHLKRHPGATRPGALARLLCVAALWGCAGWPRSHAPNVVTAPAPSDLERHCAWYGAADGDVLYVGESAFWWAMRQAGGDPRADLVRPGPRRIGRFDLERERWLEPLPAGDPESPSGVWDVHPTGGQVYFTTFFEDAGRVDLATGEIVSFADAGRGLNELAAGPAGQVLVSRYGSGRDSLGNGELLTLAPDGEVVERFHLPPPDGHRVAPKTPAWDPARGQIWTTTDLFPIGEGEIRHDDYRIDRAGGAARRSDHPELQFVAVGPEGRLYRVEADGALWLAVVPPPESAEPERRILLDPDFPSALDFAQDLKLADDGRIVVTRWNGTVHVVDRAGVVSTLALPRLDPDGLYYTAVLHGDRLCATHCADVTVVCVDAP